jgi:hypothetical protein
MSLLLLASLQLLGSLLLQHSCSYSTGIPAVTAKFYFLTVMKKIFLKTLRHFGTVLRKFPPDRRIFVSAA